MNSWIARVFSTLKGEKESLELPLELYSEILQYVDIQTGVRCRAVCTTFRECIDSLVGVDLGSRDAVVSFEERLKSRDILKNQQKEESQLIDQKKRIIELGNDFCKREFLGRRPNLEYKLYRKSINGYEVGFALGTVFKKNADLQKIPEVIAKYTALEVNMNNQWEKNFNEIRKRHAHLSWSLGIIVITFIFLPIENILESAMFYDWRDEVDPSGSRLKLNLVLLMFSMNVLACIICFKPFLIMDVRKLIVLPLYLVLCKWFNTCLWACAPGYQNYLQIPLWIALLSGMIPIFAMLTTRCDCFCSLGK